MKTEKKLVNVRMSEGLIEELSEASDRLEISQSQFIRDAVKEKVATTKEPVPAPEAEVVTCT